MKETLNKTELDTLLVSSSPHLHRGGNTRNIMFDVIIALMPALIMSAVLFGLRAPILTLTCVTACVFTEYISRLIMKREQSIYDLSAVVTGILLAFTFPVNMPIWQAILSCVFAIVVAKQLFGGIGQNFVNPAIAGRIFATVSFSSSFTSYASPLIGKADAISDATSTATDALSSATPLTSIGSGVESSYSYFDLFFGITPGTIGEVCAAALLLGAIYLIVRGVISPTIPVAYLGTVGIFALILGIDPVSYILAGGLMLGALFMATDYTTSPLNLKGKIVFGIGCGLLTVVIRVWGSLPEGVAFAIFFMNILVPLIERFTRNSGISTWFSERRRVREPK